LFEYLAQENSAIYNQSDRSNLKIMPNSFELAFFLLLMTTFFV